jgi:hypothetical protein
MNAATACSVIQHYMPLALYKALLKENISIPIDFIRP